MSALDHARDRLYAAPLPDFVATRKALVKELEAAGEPDAARAIGAAKKPAATAWAVDAVAHAHAHAMRAFLRAVDAVRDAQRAALEGKGTARFEEARDALSKETTRVLHLAREALERADARWTPEAQRRITRTLQAAPFASGEDRERLARGWLEADLETADPFEAMAAMAPSIRRPHAHANANAHQANAPAHAAPSPTAQDRAAARAREKARREAAKHAAALEADADAKERHARDLAARAEAAERAAEKARRDADRARDDARVAREAAKKAREAVDG
jgi:hypothetical protein